MKQHVIRHSDVSHSFEVERASGPDLRGFRKRLVIRVNPFLNTFKFIVEPYDSQRKEFFDVENAVDHYNEL
ncbi:hypothetical protein EVB55_005 [Rhizobium phage RHph_Y68]|uniref:Uncharacterized protein n=1 Tax=Rhizobium phage RHph_Y68 TaxID=2509787 RepID=A0A7S5QY36_9CAUD|nr:hypothetical protein PP934_gp005 [Rhizobium phage RHph_Y68]QIG67940.1 hypothetical protein EVB55_005 [Rhizobium phage RHph_Y68]